MRCRRIPGNGGNDAELAPGVFEHRVLLDMDFKESFNVRGIDLFSGQGIRVEPERTQCIVGGPFGVAQAFQVLHVDLPRNALTAEGMWNRNSTPLPPRRR